MLVMIILIVVIVLLLIVVYLLHKNNKQFSQQQPKPSVTLTALPAPEAILHSTPPSHLGLPNTLPQPVPVGNDSKSSLQIAILPIIVVGDRNEKVNLLHNGDNKAEKGGGKMGTSKKENYLERRNPTQNSISSEVLFGDKCNDENSKKEEDATSLSGSDSSSSKFDEQEAAAVFKMLIESIPALSKFATLMRGATNESNKEEERDYFYAGTKQLYSNDAKLSQKEKEIIAHHEASHTVISHLLGFPVQKVTLVKKDHFLGLTIFDNAGKLLWTKTECNNLMVSLLASSAGELHFLMVVHYGMGEAIGPFDPKILTSESKKEERDKQITKIWTNAWSKAQYLVGQHHKLIKKLALSLMEKNEIEQDELLENYLR